MPLQVGRHCEDEMLAIERFQTLRDGLEELQATSRYVPLHTVAYRCIPLYTGLEELQARDMTVTRPLHDRYIAVTRPLHDRYMAVTGGAAGARGGARGYRSIDGQAGSSY